MQEALSCVIREVERVVTTPYAPALHRLESIVENVSNGILRQWAEYKPCQVSLLAALIVEQLPGSLKLLERFAYAPQCRDAILKRQPALLDQLLQQSIEGGDVETCNACISMLSSCLPDDVAIPARIPLFLTNQLQKMVQEPCARTIRPLYQVMDGLLGNSNVLKILPNDLMASFQVQSTGILRNLNDPMGSLLCLATFARIRRLWQPPANETHQPMWLNSICQMFGPKRAAKTLDLVVISAIMACSNTCNGYSSEERVVLVKLAIEICENFDEDLKGSWLSTNSPKMVKLCDKLRRKDIDSDLQIMGLTLLTNFSQSLLLPREIYNITRERLFAYENFLISNELPESAKQTLLERVLARFDAVEIAKFLSYVISNLRPKEANDSPNIATIRVNVLAMSAIKKSNQHLTSVRSYLEHLPLADEKVLRTYVEEFSSCTDSYSCEASIFCHSAIQTWKNLLFLEIVSCFQASAARLSDNSLVAPSQSHDLLMFFLDCLKPQARKQTICQFSKATEPERVGGLRQKAISPSLTLSTDNPSRDWRSRLAESLLENAQTSHKSIIQQMEAVCQDFESRCGSIEKPLAAAIQERDDLRRQLEKTREINMELEDRVLQSSQLVSSLTSERDQLAEGNRNFSLQVEHLTEQVDELQNELNSVRKQSHDSIESERIKARNRELDLMATVAERDDLLDEQQADMDALKKENAQLKEKLDAASEQNTKRSRECDALHSEISNLQNKAAEECDSLRHEITRLNQVMEIRESTNAEKDNRIMALSDTNKDLSRELQFLKERVEHEKLDGENLRSAIEEERQRHRSAISEIESKHAAQIAQVHSDAQHASERHRHEMTAVRTNAENAAAKAEKDLRTRDKRIQYLENKVESLRNERAAKAREFCEAQEHISRLMDVMGFSKDQKGDKNAKSTTSGPKSREPRRSSRLAGLQTQSFLLPSQNETTAAMNSALSIVPPPPPTTDYSFQQHSRMRSRHASNPISFDLTRSFSPNRKEAGVRDREPLRQPLGDVDRNSPTKSQQGSQKGGESNGIQQKLSQKKTQSQTNVDGTEWGDVDLDFDDDDIFTSTVAR